jgi:16S rRNA (guanine527-N7)-methyltransferase
MVKTEDQAKAWLAALPECDEAAMARLARLAALLVEENSQQNLVSAASLDQVWQRHIVDSAQLLSHVPRETAGSWLDLGTGAGFPGMVIAALRPDLPVVMVESRARRVEWLERARLALGLDNARVEGARLELVEAFPAAVISARAFAPLDRLVALSARFSTSDTLWLLPKGRSAGQELDMLRGWIHTFHVEQSLTDAEAGVIVGRLSGARKGRKGPKP